MREDSGPVFPFLSQVPRGDTADVYFLRTRDLLDKLGKDPHVGMEIFISRHGLCCGVSQVVQLLAQTGFAGELWTVDEGQALHAGDSAAQIYGRYSSFGMYETAILGILGSCSGWTTSARHVVDAASPVPVISFGARHVHPNVAGIMDYCAVVGGCVGCSTPLGAALSGTVPSGTMPHAYVLISGDTVEAAEAFDRLMPRDLPRIVLVDTFQDEVTESLAVAEALGPQLHSVRLDTPVERGGVTAELVHEVRKCLDRAGFQQVQINVSGGITPDRIQAFRAADAPIDSYGVGSYISSASPIDYTGDVREIEGRPVSKLGRVPGMRDRDGLTRRL